jgi:16S rRNA (guanine527-N7)-methyltransferase
MVSVELVYSYFPELNQAQRDQMNALWGLYENWNSQINVISRKDMDSFYERHVLHSLAIAQLNPFLAEARVLDVGTGGGFPGIPLAIMFPSTQFHLVDSIGKKIKVVKAVVEALELRNVEVSNTRAENIRTKVDFVVSRAVAPTGKLHQWVKNIIKPGHKHQLANGMLLLKGGDLSAEIEESGLFVQEFPLSNYYKEPFFETKKVVYVPYTENGITPLRKSI